MVLSLRALKKLLRESLTDSTCQYLNLRKHCIFVDLLLMVSYVQSTLRKELFKLCISVEFLLMISYVQGTLRKELLIVIFVERFKTTTSEKLH